MNILNSLKPPFYFELSIEKNRFDNNNILFNIVAYSTL